MPPNHLPLLAEYCLRTAGPLLEIGCHPIVSPALHYIAGQRILVTVAETYEDKVWYGRFKSESHVVMQAEPGSPMARFDVALIAAAKLEDRIAWIDALADKCDYLVVPDCGPKGANYPVDYFPHKRVWAWLGAPYTLVCSRTERVDGKT
jgi:hypothetical protein